MFSTRGLVITERNWLEVYPWEKWRGNELPPLAPGMRFPPVHLTMHEVRPRTRARMHAHACICMHSDDCAWKNGLS